MLGRIHEVAGEYGIAVSRLKAEKVFNADLAAAYNILITRVLKLIGVIGRPEIKSPERGDVIPKLLLAATFAL
ncbi:MAG: hypothetical protein DSO01_00595 [Archaeoglobi archaeon]|nr:MAG: hypothetical protein DSO01_00595 [Archaeoglobi archaeon]